MEVEGVNDFKALRAKFQNNSNFSNTLLQPAKRPPADFLHPSCSDGKHVSGPKIPSKEERLACKQKEEQFCYTVRNSELTHSKPLAMPRAKFSNLHLSGKDEDPKDKVLQVAVGGNALPKEVPWKPCPNSCVYQQGTVNANSEDASIKNSFQHARQIWESAASQNDRKCAMVPPRHRANGTCSSAQPRATNTATAAESSKMRTAGNEQTQDFSTQKNTASHSGVSALPHAPSPPLPARRYKGTEPAPSKTTGVTGLCQPFYNQQDSSETLPYSKETASEHFHHHSAPEKQLDVTDNKLPKIKPLPSVESLGPPPEKPQRPPKVNLCSFQHSASPLERSGKTAAVEEEYMTPENTAVEESHDYEDTISYLKPCGTEMSSCTTQAPTTEAKENDKKPKSFLFTRSSAEGAIEEKTSGNFERERLQQVKKIFKISGNKDILHKVQTNEDGKSGSNILQRRLQDASSLPQTTKCPTEKSLSKDNVEYSGYVCVGALNADEEMVALSQRLKPVQSLDVYDDVEGLEGGIGQGSGACNSFTSDSFSEDYYEETYEDVQNGDDMPTRLDLDRIDKLKNFFKKEKFKLKNTKMKENLRMFSSSVPNLDIVSQEATAYDDSVTQKDTKEKDEKSKNWKLKFLMTKEEKDRKRSSEDAESSSSRAIFKAKKGNAEKNKKMAKEERVFRETFMYNKEIAVINTAFAQSSVSSKGKQDLPITAGEQLDIIDVTEGNQMLCRNAEGKYGYVLVEHLNFSRLY
ncbi:FYN-binding protein 2 isoform X1 [Alligator sinensis]|uniref:FYN-binding protein 2 n=1 Tax=Alligator sinensis TaxID=38654 RepID=A0A1U7RTS5_ALLSI|nr:FYN-binding protein 2 isoform X1 [Alligator sinensis]